MDAWMDGWKKKFLWTFFIIYFTYFPMVRSFRGGGCKDPSQPHAYLATCLFSHHVYLCLHNLFILQTTIHMNVTYYLTIDKVLVHFGSEVRKVSYTSRVIWGLTSRWRWCRYVFVLLNAK